MTPREIATYGTPRRADYVRVVVVAGRHGPLTRVVWRDPETSRRRAHAFTGDGAKVERQARTLAESLTVKLREGERANTAAAQATVRSVWEAYWPVSFPNLRPNTRDNYAREFAAFADVVGWETKAARIKLRHLDTVRTHYRRLGWEHSTVRHVVTTAKQVWTWAEGRELLTKNPLYAYRYTVPKDERKASPAEYSAEEFVAIVAALSPERGDQWRAWVALMICGAQGARSHAVLHLQWADVDEDAGVITWRAAFDKNGLEWTQPLRTPTRRALTVARAWQAGERGTRRWTYDTPWVLPPGSSLSKSPTYTAGSLYTVLCGAETRAGITHLPGRAAHGLRRLLAGEVHELTGDAMLALQAIGDRDPKMLSRYLKTRDRRVRDAFDRLDDATAPEPASVA